MATMELNGTEIWFEDSGGDGEVVLFHHGYTGSHDSWSSIIPGLSTTRRYIMMDGRGAGDSGRPDDDSYTLEQYRDDVIALVDALGIDRFSYVGHSMGGGIGFHLGLEHAHRLDKLILIAPIPSGGVETLGTSRDASRALWYAQDEERILRAAILGAPRPEIIDETRARARVKRALSVSKGHYEQSWESMAKMDVTDRLAELTTPTLIIAGAADFLVRANVEDYLRLPNASLHVFNRTGHLVPRDVPEALAEVVEDFLDHGVVTINTLIARVTGGT